MKKLLLSAALVIATLAGQAQLPEVNSMQRVNLPEGTIVLYPTMSPDGNFIVYSEAGHDGLSKVSLDGNAQVIAANASGQDVAISRDGSRVIFRRSITGQDKLRRTSLVSVNLNSGSEDQLVAPTRHLNAGVSLKDNTVAAVVDGKKMVRRLGGGNAPAGAVVSIDYGHLTYTADGNTRVLDPQGRGSYIWPSLSPDGTKICYYLSGRGCFVCNVDGTAVADLGLIRAAKWLDNNTIVGMNDTDNGEVTTASNIVVMNLKGERRALTDDSLIAMYPSPSADGKHIAFKSADGRLFVLNLK